ncbi:molybdopterin-dependent oxidoreductase [Ancylobacter sp. 6x-1]|uniref:Molybdopterin-dependent oxidoreductase n=1 Tax=Ancylobacter crimeensis TaxID=2579147 RepID=A0ABT0D983_9HYPH|nr:molybdopterin cofactor-binding domain-containing protein [Ancylobacter crimeensis]MCK0196514.1 molybdopterin-dependent oxidoreductase [Ancylobacter crimeensis]
MTRIPDPAGFRPDRRSFLTGSLALVVAASLPLGSRMARAAAAGPFAPNAFIRISEDGRIVLIMRDVEMGQGIWTGASMLMAEELDVGLDQVEPDFAPPDDKLYANPLLGQQATGGSTSIRADWEGLRKPAAIARRALVEAAAREWKVAPADCTVERGVVRHAASGRSASYGSLVALAATSPLPQDAPLKDRKDWKLIGTSQKRVDTRHKVDGGATYGIDVKLPGMKIALLARCPVLGGKLVSVDEASALKVKGAHAVLKLEDAVAVVGDHYWAAKQGLDALAAKWDLGPNARLTQADIVRGHEEASKGEGVVARQEGDPDAAIAGAAKKLSAVYQLPFLAHATMEPANCTVHVTPDGVEVWCGTQVPTRAQAAAAEATGQPVEKVRLHNHLIGGGFGRRLEWEYVGIAAAFAKQVDYPLKVVWSREEDIQHDRFRPYYYDRLSAGLDADGRITGWTHKVTGSSVMARWAPPGMRENGIDPDAVECAEETPYDLGPVRVSWVRHEPPGVVTAWWRGVGPAHNVFVVESFIDELAHAAGKDPVAFRRGLLEKNPRARAALDLAAKEAGWGTPLPANTGRGIMVQHAFGSFLAVVCEAEMSGSNIQLKRLVAAMDCGQAVNPDSVRAQIEGGLVFGLTAALYGEITLDEGRVEQTNFDTYQILRMNEVPPIEVHLVESSESPGGLGETGTAAAFPAIANAVFAASGKRLRKLPLNLDKASSG